MASKGKQRDYVVRITVPVPELTRRPFLLMLHLYTAMILATFVAELQRQCIVSGKRGRLQRQNDGRWKLSVSGVWLWWKPALERRLGWTLLAGSFLFTVGMGLYFLLNP